MFPVLVYVYRRLAIAEERETRRRFGDRWDAYAAVTPRFLPRPADSKPRPPRAEEVTAP
jgi:protein-S-isoprenylcysteine O-methyltransferase Ste14